MRAAYGEGMSGRRCIGDSAANGHLDRVNRPQFGRLGQVGDWRGSWPYPSGTGTAGA